MPYYDPFSYIFSLLWFLIFIFIIFSPWYKRMALIRAREEVIKKLEAKRKSRVITMIHRQEQIGFFGIPIFRFITIEDSERVLRAIRMTPYDMPIDLIIHTPGCLGLTVNTEVPEEVYELMELYEQPMSSQSPSVQYIPVPYKSPQQQQNAK